MTDCTTPCRASNAPVSRASDRNIVILVLNGIIMGSPKAAFPLIRLHKEQYDDDSDRLIHFTNDLKDLNIKHNCNQLK